MLFLLIGWSALIAGCVIILLAFVQYFVAGSLSAVQKRCSVSFFACFSLFIIMHGGDNDDNNSDNNGDDISDDLISNSYTFNSSASFYS